MTNGLLCADYARDRELKCSHVYRYKLRAWTAVSALRRAGFPDRGLTFLDLGCAEGRTLKFIADVCPDNEFVGVEASTELVSVGRELYPELRILEGFAEEISVEDLGGVADAILALAVIEHVPDPLLFLKSAGGLLANDGILIVSTPVPFWDAVAVRARMLDDGQHEEHLGKKRLFDLFADAGFEIIEYQRFMWAPLGVLPYIGISPSIEFGRRVDAVFGRIPGLGLLCVNQLVVARKKAPSFS